MTPGYEEFTEQQSVSLDPDHYINKSPLQMVTQFAQCMGQTLDYDYIQNSFLDKMRLSLVSEEFDEVCAAENQENLLKELADLVYVTYGYVATFGWDLDAGLRRVHASNMSKLGYDGRPIFREDGKVLKGPNYQEPNLSDLVRG